MKYPIPLDTLLVELADYCNLSCIMCDMSEEGRRRHGHPNPEKPIHTTIGKCLPLTSFKKIINDVNKAGLYVGQLSLFWLGEPTLNPDLDAMIEYLGEHSGGIKGWLLHTNGQLLKRSTLMLLFRQSGNNTLHFSVDAASQEVYSRMRRGGDYKRLVDSIRAVLDLRQRIPSQNLRIVLQFIVLEENLRDAKEFAAFWGREFEMRGLNYAIARDYSQHSHNTIFFRQEIACPHLQAGADELHSQVCDQLRIPRIMPNNPTHIQKARPPCPGPFKAPVIHVDGRVTVCCKDVGLELCLGNINETSFEKIWLGEMANKIRMAHIKGELDKIPKCQSCINLDGSHVSDSEVEAYLRYSGVPELIEIYRKRMAGKC